MRVSKRQYRKSKLLKKKQYRKLKLKGGSKRKLKLLKRGSKRKSKLKGGTEGGTEEESVYDLTGDQRKMYSLTPTQNVQAKELTDLKSKWFYESFNRVEAENELADKPIGTFLVHKNNKVREAQYETAVSTRSVPYWDITVKKSEDAGTSLFWYGLIEENDNNNGYFINIGPSEADADYNEILEFTSMENLVATLMTDKPLAQKIGLSVDLTLNLSADEEEFGIELLEALESSKYSDKDLIDNDINIHTKLKSRGKFTIRSDCVNKYVSKSGDGTFIIYKSHSEKVKLPTLRRQLEQAFDGNYYFTYHGTIAVKERGKTKNVYIIYAKNNAPPIPHKDGVAVGAHTPQLSSRSGYGLFYPFEKAPSPTSQDVPAKSTELYSSVDKLLNNQTIITANNYYRNNRTTKGYLVCDYLA